MRVMDNDIPATLPAPAVREEGKPDASRSEPRSRRGIGLVLTVIALLLAGFVWWMLEQRAHKQDLAHENALRESAVSTQLSDLVRVNEQLRRDIDSLRARLADSDTVNRGVREELLGFGERSRSLEDAVAHLADQRLTSRDALALNEAEFVLQLAGERLALFHDAAAAIAAYRLADSALAAAEDPLFASVRQTIGAEIHALEAAQPLQTQATLGALAGLRDALAALPLKSAVAADTSRGAGERSRFKEIFAQFVRISDDRATPALASRDAGLARTLAAIDLRTAEAALFARDAEAFNGAIARARADIASTFDGDAAPVRDALVTLDRLAATPLAPALPELGSALRELRNLRTTRALSRQPVAPVTPEANDGGANP
jgi:uroporphyrin-3 C-methyltransferase